MPSPGLMRLRCQIDANSLPTAVTTLATKMEQVCPGMPYDVAELTCAPAPNSTTPRLVGPPWRFDFTVLLTTMI